MKRPRVLMVGPFPKDPSRINGGVAAALMYLSNALAISGEVELFGARIVEGESGDERVSGFGWPMFDIALGHGSLTTGYRRQQRRLDDLVGKLLPDIVHAHGVDISGYLSVRTGAPTVVTVHGLLMECARLQTGLIEKARSMLAAALTERSTVRRARDLIAISPYVRTYYGLDIVGKCHDIPNAVAAAYFNAVRRPQSGRFLFAGRISKGKGLVDLLNALAINRASAITVMLAGAVPDPKYERQLQRQIRALELEEHVECLGLLDESALLEEFELATALVLPSYQETAPMVVQQAMAAGLPVIATQVGGVPHQVEQNITGFLFEPGDSHSLATMMMQMVENPELARKFGAAAKSLALERYSAGIVASATADVYREIMMRSAKDTST